MALTEIDICICTHNPRRPVFTKVLESIARQDLKDCDVEVIIIDNNSDEPVKDRDCSPLVSAGLRYRVVRENRLGNVFARARAIMESRAHWILFVDDDNELMPNYLRIGIDIIKTRSDIGCFGGRLLASNCLQPKGWILPFLPHLAIRDFGDEEITSVADHWGPWEPATAGAFVRRPVLDLYLQRIRKDRLAHMLGRKGSKSLNSCEDSLLMYGSHSLGLANSYQPRLALIHHIRPSRLRFAYMFRLLMGYGRSEIILDRLCGRPMPRAESFVQVSLRLMRSFAAEARRSSLPYACCMAAYRAAREWESRKVVEREP